MKKIKAFIIHALGGCTKGECFRHGEFSFKAGQQSVTESLMLEAEILYGKPAEEWCREMYSLIKDLDEVSKRQVE